MNHQLWVCTINWSKTKIQISCDTKNIPSTVSVLNNHRLTSSTPLYILELDRSSACIDSTCGNDQDVPLQRIELARSCMTTTSDNFAHSSNRWRWKLQGLWLLICGVIEKHTYLVYFLLVGLLQFMLYGLLNTLLRKLQSVQNATAWLITGTRRSDHIPLLRELHRPPIRERVKFKVACLVRQSLSGQAPLYFADDCRLVSDSTRRSLRSADVSTCVLPPTLSSYGDWTFAAAGPRLWNSLPVQLRNPDITYGVFRRPLKGHLFREAWTRRSVTSDMRRHRKTLTYLLTYSPYQ